MENVGIGVIGCDDMGIRLAIHAHDIEGMEVISVYDRQVESAKNLASDIDVDYTTDYRELMSDERIRTVIIPTSLTTRQIWEEAEKTEKCLSFGIGKDMSEYEIQHMLIEHILPTEAWDKAFQKAVKLLSRSE